MKNVIYLVKNALMEKRRLSDKEMELIIDVLLNFYGVCNNVKSIKIDYHDEHFAPAGYNADDKILYFNMNEINEQIFKQFYNDKKSYTFNEYYILEQLTLIFHEIRHVLQQGQYFDDNEVIKNIIMDSNLKKYNDEVYAKYYSLFPVEKDAIVFSCEETTKLINMCDYFNQSIIKEMYIVGFNNIINGYNPSCPREGTLKEFYEKVVCNSEEYYRLQALSSNLTTHDKMSFNFSLNDYDLRKILLVPGLISKGFNPSVVLKKEIKYK